MRPLSFSWHLASASTPHPPRFAANTHIEPLTTPAPNTEGVPAKTRGVERGTSESLTSPSPQSLIPSPFCSTYLCRAHTERYSPLNPLLSASHAVQHGHGPRASSTRPRPGQGPHPRPGPQRAPRSHRRRRIAPKERIHRPRTPPCCHRAPLRVATRPTHKDVAHSRFASSRGTTHYIERAPLAS